jgi:hypothetical protein
VEYARDLGAEASCRARDKGGLAGQVKHSSLLMN